MIIFVKYTMRKWTHGLSQEMLIEGPRKDLETVPSLFAMMSSWTFGKELLNLKTNIWLVPKILEFDKFTGHNINQKYLISAILKQSEILREIKDIILHI